MMRVLAGRELAAAIRRILHGNGELHCAVAFWGPAAGAQAANRSAKVVLDISMGGTSRNALKALGVPGNPNVRVLDRLHAKIYISDDCAVIGSANASANALGSANSAPVLEETGVWIGRDEDPDAYRDAMRIFRRYWRAAKVAGPDDLQRAVRVPLFAPARDQSPGRGSMGSVLDELLAAPERFAQTVFIFADARLDPDERRLARDAYEADTEVAGEGGRQLICATYDGAEAAALQECTYVIMYWFGASANIYAYHDIVRVRSSSGLIGLYGRRHWSTVRNRLGILGLSTIDGFWKADCRRGAAIAGSEGGSQGERFVVMRHDELHEALEA